MSDYAQLQSSIDRVIGKIGLQRTKHLLDSFLDNTSVSQNEHEKVKLVSHYLVNLAIKVYELKEAQFYESTIRQYRDARLCCFHLLRKYTEDSYSKIGLFFNCKGRKVMYGCCAVEARLSMPQGNLRFTSNYNEMESRLLEFIGKID